MGESRFPKDVRAAAVKCVACNAPVVETVEREYRCVRCGSAPVAKRSGLHKGDDHGN